MDNAIIIKTKLDTSDFDRQIDYLKDHLEALEEEYETLRNEKPFEGQTEQLRKMSTEIISTKKKLASLNAEKDKMNKAGFNGMIQSVDNIGNGMSKIIGKVAKWGLAVLGVRSAYNFIKQSVSTLAQYDDNLAKDIEYIRYALANSLRPVIEWIIQAIYKLIGLVGGFIKLLTGKNIFENSGVKDFNKAVNKGSKSVKDLKKQLAGFDEMNVLQDTSSSGGGAGGGTPSIDLKKMVDDFTQADADKVFEDIDKAITKGRTSLAEYQEELWSLLENKQGFEDAYGEWSVFVYGISEMWSGVVDVVAGAWDTISGLIGMFIDIIKGDWDSLGQHWNQFVTGLGEIIMGMIKLVWGFIETAVGVVIGILASFGKWLWNDIIVPIGKWFGDVGKKIGDAFSNAWKWVKEKWQGAGEWFSNIGTKIKNVFTGIGSKIKSIFSSVWGAITGGISAVYNKIISTVKGAINWIIDKVNWLIRKINDKLRIKVPDKVPGIGGLEWSVNINEIPRLAKGGIVNNPGAGVFMGNYIAGERGAEAVLPLDDNTMDRLGSAIARHMTINATMVNQMNGRTISREIKQIMNEQDFGFNR